VDTTIKKNIVYTALFDIGRGEVDGRKFSHYINWLKKTIEIFPNIYVFHEGNIKEIDSLKCNSVKINLSELEIYSRLPNLINLLNTFNPIASNDITFKIPKYSLVQFAKFELAKRVSEIVKTESVLWVDAGVSRFIDSSNKDFLLFNSQLLIENQFDAAFEIDLRKNFDFKKLVIKNPKPGSCKRVLSGTSFWLNSIAIDTFISLVDEKLDQWERIGVWDADQVLIRQILHENKFKSRYIIQNENETGSVARTLGGGYISKSSISDKILANMI